MESSLSSIVMSSATILFRNYSISIKVMGKKGPFFSLKLKIHQDLELLSMIKNQEKYKNLLKNQNTLLAIISMQESMFSIHQFWTECLKDFA